MTDSEADRSPLDLAAAACHVPFEEALDAIESNLSGGVIHVLRRGREVHGALLAEVGLDGAGPDAWEDRAEALLEYRRRVLGEVLTPLRLVFGSGGPTAFALDVLDQAVSEATASARALPAHVDGTWHADALAHRSSDGIGRRARKRVARVLSPARKAGEPRQVPVRAVALHHLGETLAPEVDDTAADALRTWAAWERDLELAWIEWSESILPALVRAELPEDAVEEAPSAEEREDDPDPSLWSEIAEAARRFDKTLASLVHDCPLQGIVADIRGRLDSVREALSSDMAVAGSFVFRPEDTHRIEPALDRVGQMRAGLEEWDAGVANRLQLYESLLGILAGASAVQRRLVVRVREEQLATTSVLSEVAEEMEVLAEDLSTSDGNADAEGTGAEERLRRLGPRVSAILEPAASAVPASSDVDRAIQAGANATVDALLAMIRQAPSSLELHPEDGRLPGAKRKPEVRSVALQDLARQSFDALRIERIRSSTTNLVGAIDEVRADVDELPNVFSFAFDAAQAELAEGEADAESNAVGLVTEAVLSMAESLRNADRSLDAAVAKAQGRLTAEVTDGSLGLLERVAAGRVQARLLAARSWFAELRVWINDRFGPPLERASRSAIARGKLFRRWASRGLRKGTEMVGTPSATGEASTRTLRLLGDADATLSDFPLVYQRLFTLQPVSDSTLLAGRAGELAHAFTRWKQWRDSEGVPLIVRGRPGSGITSFLNVLRTEITEAEGKLGQVVLNRRMVGEEALARRLSAEVGVDEVSTLDDLAAAIFDAPRGSVPDAVFMDNLEHLYLRVPRGTDLIERLLTLMAETEPRIFWIGGVTTSAWQLVSAAEPTAVSQVEVLKLEELTGSELREAMMIRHRRSGLPLRFKEPEGNRRMLRQRLKRLRDPEAYDDLLAAAFFDRLEKTSSRHLRLALFQWLMATDFEQGEGVVMVPPERPDFTILDSLTLTQNFTLKAFLEHRTLTLEEHDRIFRLPRQESYQIFESLQNRRLIESVTSDGGDLPQRSEIEEDLHYRVRPLLVGAVIFHLRGRNIVH